MLFASTGLLSIAQEMEDKIKKKYLMTTEINCLLIAGCA